MTDSAPNNAAPLFAEKPKLYRPVEVKLDPRHLVLDLPKLLRKGRARRTDLLRALLELALARIAISRRTTRELRIPDVDPTEGQHRIAPSPAEQRIIARVSAAIEIASPRVPWRADCLIRCLAARRWLAANHIPSRISIGMKREASDSADGTLLAHAWLTAGDTVVTGGDVADFAVFSTRGTT